MALRATSEAGAAISLDDVKRHLRVDYSDDDLYIDGLISTAAKWICGWLGISLGVQTWELTLDAFPSERIVIPRPPLVSVQDVEYVDIDGNTQDYTVFRVFSVDSSDSGFILPAYNQNWPSTRVQPEAVKIAFTSGTDVVGTDIKHAILLLVSGWYENRESVSEKPPSAIPFGVDALLFPNRNWSA